MFSNNTLQNISFLNGGGEMGKLTREKDWSKTSLGNADNWPQSLRTTLSIILNSKFPMFLFWGTDHICFYNDAYRPSLGNDGKHPAILGSKGADFWKEIWEDIKPLINNVLAGGEANLTEDQLLPIYRNGAMEDVYWTFSYSAVNDETGKPAGVFVTCNETTKQVNAIENLKASEHRFRDMIFSSPSLISILKGEDLIIDIANDAILETWGKGKDVIGKPFLSVLPEIIDQGFDKILKEVYKTGIPYNAYEMPVTLIRNGVAEISYYTFVYQVQRDRNGVIDSLTIFATDVTQQATLNKKVYENERQIKEAKDKLELTFANVPTAIFLYDKNKELLLANEKAALLLNYSNVETLLNKKKYSTIMEDATEKFFIENENDEIFITKDLPTIVALESKTPTERIFSIKDKKNGAKKWLLDKSAPILDEDGNISMVLTTSTDITAQKLAEENIRNSEKRFRSLADEAPMWVWITDKDINIQYANLEVLHYVGLSHYSEFTVQVWNSSLHEEDLILVMNKFKEAAEKRTAFDFEARIKNAKTGNFEWFYLKGIPHIEDEIFTGFIGTAINIQEQKAATEILEYRKALLESNNEANLDGALLVDAKGKIISYNKRFIEIWNMPKHIIDAKDDEAALEHALSQLINPEQFIEKVKYLYEHPTETSKDELEYKDGKIIERYGYPVVGADGTYYAWSWIFRDITQQKNDEKIIKESEGRFRMMAETLPQLIWVTDEKGKREYASGRWQEYTGVNPADFEALKQIVHPSDFEEINKVWKHSLETGEVYKHEVRIKSKTQEYRWFAVRGEAVINRENKIEKWVGAFTDIHTQKSFAQELKMQVDNRTKELAALNISLLGKNESLSISESFNRALTEVSPNVVYIFDIEKNNAVFLNKTALDILGYTWEEINKRNSPLKKIIHNDDINSLKLAFHKMKTSALGEVIEHEYRIKNYLGNWVPFLVREVAFKRNSKNEVYQVLGIGVDITELKKSKIILEQNNADLEKMNKELQSFAYISSHDLQEPLRKIQTFTNQITESETDNLSEKGKDYFRRIQKSAARMRQLIDDLLSYSRANDTNIKFETVNLNKFIKELTADFLDDVNFQHAVIDVNAPCNALVITFQFRQLISNLISNALKFKKENVAPHITITAKTEKGSKLVNEKMLEDKNYCHIKIKDNGIGFEPRYSEKIFEVFQRLHGRAEYEGTGIGLAIVKKIVENHHGIITATSNLNEGAVFDIYLPQ